MHYLFQEAPEKQSVVSGRCFGSLTVGVGHLCLWGDHSLRGVVKFRALLGRRAGALYRWRWMACALAIGLAVLGWLADAQGYLDALDIASTWAAMWLLVTHSLFGLVSAHGLLAGCWLLALPLGVAARIGVGQVINPT